MPPDENKRVLAAYVTDVLVNQHPDAAATYLDPGVRFHPAPEPRGSAGKGDPFVLAFLIGHQPDAARQYAHRKGMTEPGGRPPAAAVIDAATLAAFPDFRFEPREMVAEGETVVLRFRITGTHTGASFLGTPPSGKAFQLDGLVLYRFAGGKIVEVWPMWDPTGPLLQLGIA